MKTSRIRLRGVSFIKRVQILMAISVVSSTNSCISSKKKSMKKLIHVQSFTILGASLCLNPLTPPCKTMDYRSKRSCLVHSVHCVQQCHGDGQKYMKLQYTKLTFIKLKSNGMKVFMQLFLPTPASDC